LINTNGLGYGGMNTGGGDDGGDDCGHIRGGGGIS
jgi:hypothetical protein